MWKTVYLYQDFCTLLATADRRLQKAVEVFQDYMLIEMIKFESWEPFILIFNAVSLSDLSK